MANPATLSDLRTRARRLADMELSAFVSDSEVTDYVNQALAELHDLVIDLNPEMFETTSDFATVAGTSTYSLPSAFYKLLGVDHIQGNGTRYTLQRYMRRERNRRQGDFEPDIVSLATLQYKLTGGNQIEFIPDPDGVGTIRLYYIPQLTLLSGDADVVEAQLPIGWEQYVEVDAAIQMLLKEESDTTALERRKAIIQARIINVAKPRDASDPAYIVDVLESDERGYVF